MRIAMVSEHASPLAALGGVDAGGQNVHVAELSRSLVERGHDVTVYTRRDHPALKTIETVDGVEVVNVTAGPARQVPKDRLLPYMPPLANGIVADWPRIRPDIVHSHFWMSGVAAIEAARTANSRFVRGRVPVIHTFHALGTVKRRHQADADTSPPERQWLEPWVAHTVDRIIATCSDELAELESLGVHSSRVSVAPCGVDTELLTPTGRTDPKGRRHRIGVVGRLVPRKGVELVIQALALLADRGRKDIELVIVGGSVEGRRDEETRRLAGIARSLGVANRVFFRGSVPHPELPPLMRSFDTVVCAPWYEPFGIVPLEAMACGVPVIGTAVGGLLDTIIDGETGIHVPPKDPEAIASAITRVLGDPHLADRLARNACERISREYTWQRVATLTESVYEQLAASPPAAAVGL